MATISDAGTPLNSALPQLLPKQIDRLVDQLIDLPAGTSAPGELSLALPLNTPSPDRKRWDRATALVAAAAVVVGSAVVFGVHRARSSTASLGVSTTEACAPIPEVGPNHDVPQGLPQRFTAADMEWAGSVEELYSWFPHVVRGTVNAVVELNGRTAMEVCTHEGSVGGDLFATGDTVLVDALPAYAGAVPVGTQIVAYVQLTSDPRALFYAPPPILAVTHIQALALQLPGSDTVYFPDYGGEVVGNINDLLPG